MFGRYPLMFGGGLLMVVILSLTLSYGDQQSSSSTVYVTTTDEQGGGGEDATTARGQKNSLGSHLEEAASIDGTAVVVDRSDGEVFHFSKARQVVIGRSHGGHKGGNVSSSKEERLQDKTTDSAAPVVQKSASTTSSAASSFFRASGLDPGYFKSDSHYDDPTVHVDQPNGLHDREVFSVEGYLRKWYSSSTSFSDPSQKVETIDALLSNFCRSQGGGGRFIHQKDPSRWPQIHYGLMINKELDMLEVALHEFGPLLASITIVEGTSSHSLRPRNLTWPRSRQQQRWDPFRNRIDYVVWQGDMLLFEHPGGSGGAFGEDGKRSKSSWDKIRPQKPSGWVVEKGQRAAFISRLRQRYGLRDIQFTQSSSGSSSSSSSSPDVNSIIIANMDLDEIPTREAVMTWKYCLEHVGANPNAYYPGVKGADPDKIRRFTKVWKDISKEEDELKKKKNVKDGEEEAKKGLHGGIPPAGLDPMDERFYKKPRPYLHRVNFKYHLSCTQPQRVHDYQYNTVVRWPGSTYKQEELEVLVSQQARKHVAMSLPQWKESTNFSLTVNKELLGSPYFTWHLSSFGKAADVMAKNANSPHGHLGAGAEGATVADNIRDCKVNGKPGRRLEFLSERLVPDLIARNQEFFTKVKGWIPEGLTLIPRGREKEKISPEDGITHQRQMKLDPTFLKLFDRSE